MFVKTFSLYYFFIYPNPYSTLSVSAHFLFPEFLESLAHKGFYIWHNHWIFFPGYSVPQIYEPGNSNTMKLPLRRTLVHTVRRRLPTVNPERWSERLHKNRDRPTKMLRSKS